MPIFLIYSCSPKFDHEIRVFLWTVTKISSITKVSIPSKKLLLRIFQGHQFAVCSCQVASHWVNVVINNYPKAIVKTIFDKHLTNSWTMDANKLLDACLSKTWFRLWGRSRSWTQMFQPDHRNGEKKPNKQDKEKVFHPSNEIPKIEKAWRCCPGS